MSFEVAVKGLEPLIKALDKWPDLARPLMEDASTAALLSLIPELATYPAPPEGSTYQRTGDLGRFWTFARPEFAPESSGFEASLGNARKGGEFVQGEEQAWMHQNRWSTVEDIVTTHQAAIEAYYDAALEKLIELIDRGVAGAS